MPLWVQVPIPAAWLVIDMRQFLSSRLFSLALTDKQGKGIDCHGSSLSLFSIPSLLRIPDGLPNFLNHYIIPQDLVEHVDNQQRFQECSYSLVYFAAFQLRAARLSWTRGKKSLMRNVGIVITARWVRIIEDFWVFQYIPIVLVIFVLDLSIDPLCVIPDRDAA